jgi:PEGA domain
VPGQDPLSDFSSEPSVMFVESTSAPAPWPLTLPTQPPIHAIDTTSRVISFVLGFALASLIAWVGSISGDDVAATGNSAPVTAVGRPVVAAAIQEKTRATNREPEAPTPTPVAALSTTTAASTTAAARTEAHPPTAPPVAPAKTAEPAPPLTKTLRPAVSGYRGALTLTSSPDGAQVVLNGKVVGQTPVVLNNLPVGSRAIVVRRDGYSPWSASVRVIANQRTTVRATLTPQSGG